MEPATFRPVSNNGTHQRLLAAAARVFAKDGLEGATTRAIAREAGVNEVTLFRHFQTKEKLLAAVLQNTLDQQDATLAAHPSAVPESCQRTSRDTAPDLRAVLLDIARRYEQMLSVNMPLIRTLIGEIHRHSEHELRVRKSIFVPLKEELLATVQAAQRAGKLRPEVDATVAADLFGGMVFMEALRRCGPAAPEYTTAEYQAACVDLFVRGIEQ